MSIRRGVAENPGRMVFTLPALPIRELSANKSGRQHWRDHHERVTLQAALWIGMMKEAGIGEQKTTWKWPVSITVILKGVGARSDVPNWVAHTGIKVLIDCLCEPTSVRHYGLGIIPDDRLRYVRHMGVTVYPLGTPCTVVEIAEIRLPDVA